MEFKPADIILTFNKKNWFSNAVLAVMRFFQDDPVEYQHSMLVVDDNHCVEATWGGVVKNELDSRLKDCQRYKVIRHVNLTYKQREAIAKRSEDFIGLRYSVARIVLQFFDHLLGTNYFTKRIKNVEHQVCSSLVACAYSLIVGIKFNGVHWASCDPDDIDDESEDPNSDFKSILTWEKVEV